MKRQYGSLPRPNGLFGRRREEPSLALADRGRSWNGPRSASAAAASACRLSPGKLPTSRFSSERSRKSKGLPPPSSDLSRHRVILCGPLCGRMRRSSSGTATSTWLGTWCGFRRIRSVVPEFPITSRRRPRERPTQGNLAFTGRHVGRWPERQGVDITSKHSSSPLWPRHSRLGGPRAGPDAARSSVICVSVAT
jgi:hypothetical protein